MMPHARLHLELLADRSLCIRGSTALTDSAMNFEAAHRGQMSLTPLRVSVHTAGRFRSRHATLPGTQQGGPALLVPDL